MKEFIHLHNHTEYSLLDGSARITKLVQKAKSQGARAVAITDHGSLYGVIKFYKECKKNGIKPIIGCEFYLVEDRLVKDRNNNKRYHIVLLAKNLQGFKNITKLSSIGFVEGFYERPRIDLETLKNYSSGVICLSGCIAGWISQTLLDIDCNDSYTKAKNIAIEMRDIFAEGDFYIEVQNHFLEDELRVNPLLYKIAKEIGVKTVATNDLHYVERSDAKAHDVLLCIQTASNYDDPNRFRFPNDEFYYKTYDEMMAVIPNKESLDNTVEIADKCNLEIKFHEYSIPRYTPPKEFSDDAEYLRHLAYDGLKRRYGKITPEIEERAEKELNTIITMGFASYYLIVWDFIHYARESGIPVGAGRGSGVGSIIAYAIKITDVDPLKYDLIFERFLNSSRQTMPDFDIDFCSERREEVIEYVRQKYTSQHVAQIITFGRMKKKNAIKNVARVFQIPFAEANALVKNIKDNDSKVHISDLLDRKSIHAVHELIDLYETNAVYKEILDLSMEIEDLPRDRGKHAAGVIICDTPVSDKVPLSRNGEDITTQFDMIECEELGLLKMDFLALKTLTDIKMSTDLIEKYEGVKIDFEELGYEDQQVYQMIGNGETDMVFQLESGGMKNFMSQLKPTLFEEIIAGVSLYRPGPMNHIPVYVKNKLDQNSIDYRHPKLEPILKPTYGVIVYQEQAMRITQALANYSLNEADNFRKFISKKKQEEIPAQRANFINGCIANGVNANFAAEIWQELETFGSYAFNKSHAAAYSVLSYQTAYLKHYYPVHYICAVINNRLSNPDDTSKYLKLVKDMNIKLLPPDINYCEGLFVPDNGSIRYGLACIKNVGRAAIDYVVREREENGKFKDFSDFARRVAGANINKRMIESLIYGGAFDCFGYSRKTLIANYEQIMEREISNKNLIDGGQMFFDFMVEEEYEYRIVPDNKREMLALEKQVLGSYVSGHPLDGYEEEFANFDFKIEMLNPIEDKDDITEIEEELGSETPEEKEEKFAVTDGQEIHFGGLLSEVLVKMSGKMGRQFCVANVEDMTGSTEVVFFGNVYSRYKHLLADEKLVKIKGRIRLEPDSKPQIIVREIYSWTLEEKDEVIDGRTLYINIKDQSVLDNICGVIEEYNGGTVPIKVQLNNQLYTLNCKVKNADILKNQLIGLIGFANVKLQ
ncbi:MAG: DNA polymerase III subunit alpha [Clostridiales bacterium]|nr:DNA polymerase III subunit alpha [Clostridiales bacterium]